MQRDCVFAESEYYHIYNRGNNKANVFFTPSDYERFILLLYVCNGTNRVAVKDIPQSSRGPTSGKWGEIERGEQLVDIGAYCLMPNHFHILIRERTEGGVTTFMKKLGTGYSMYINKKYDRTGGLFEGRFKARLVDSDEYLKYLFAYIHLNPVSLVDSSWKEKRLLNKKQTQKYLDTYSYSSYSDYMGTEREEGLILDRESYPQYFSTASDFTTFADEWLHLATGQKELH